MMLTKFLFKYGFVLNAFFLAIGLIFIYTDVANTFTWFLIGLNLFNLMVALIDCHRFSVYPEKQIFLVLFAIRLYQGEKASTVASALSMRYPTVSYDHFIKILAAAQMAGLITTHEKPPY